MQQTVQAPQAHFTWISSQVAKNSLQLLMGLQREHR